MEAGKIAGLFVTFVACAVLGYLIPVENFIGSAPESEEEQQVESVINIGKKKSAKDKDKDSDGDGWLLAEETPAEEDAQEVEYSEEEAPAAKKSAKSATPSQNAKSETPKQMEETPKGAKATEEAEAEPAAPKAAASDANSMPTISSAAVLPRSSKNYKLVGLNFVAKATVASGDALQYELYEIGGSEPKYKSENGSFYNVYPVDGGKYKLVVRNSRTGDEATKEVSGFNKIKKLSASELQAMLNADSQDKLFYFNFDVAKLRFDCTGVDASEVPNSLDALLASRAAFGWNVQVVGTPKYDSYNRITYFKINLSY